MYQTDNAHGKGRYIGDVIFAMGTDLKLVLLSTLLMLAFIYTPVLDDTVLKVAYGLAMLLFVPGYVFVAVLYPMRSDMNGVERAALSFGMSICIFPITAMVISYTPWGLSFDSLVVSLTDFIIFLTLVASMRRVRLPERDRFSVDFRKWLKEIKAAASGIKIDHNTAFTVILILSVISAVFTIACAITMPPHEESFTEFYVLGPNHTADSYPTSFNVGDTRDVIVGVANHEHRDVTYDLLVSLNNGASDSILYNETIPVASNQVWEKYVNLTPAQNGSGMRLSFLLYADGNMSGPYRECHFAVDVTSSTGEPASGRG